MKDVESKTARELLSSSGTMEELIERSGEELDVVSGILHRMKDKGHVTDEDDSVGLGQRRIWSVTDEGRKLIESANAE